MTCLARRHNDQMMCHHCGLVWDVNDPEPPTCLENRLPDYLQCDREDDELSLTEAVDKYVSTDLDTDILLNSVRREVGHAVFDEYARRAAGVGLFSLTICNSGSGGDGRKSMTEPISPPPPRDVKGGAKSFFDLAKRLLRKPK